MADKEKKGQASWARFQAHRALCSWSGRERRIQLRTLITSVADRAKCHQAEKNLFWQLVLGVVRSCRLLDAVMKAYLKKGTPGPGPVRQALRIGLYQILFLDRIPARAAVDQSVRLVEHKKSKALVNALLRNVADSIREETGPITDPTRQFSLSEGRVLMTENPFLPDPEARRVAYLAVFYSYPNFLVKRWLKRWGREEIVSLLQAGNTTPLLNLRINPLRGNQEMVKELLLEEGVERIVSMDGTESVLVDWAGNPANLEVLRRGLVTVQDRAAMRAVQVLDPQPGEKILDLCSAPGGKTTQAAEAMADQGDVFAWDRDPRRLLKVENAAERLGLQSIKLLKGWTLEQVLAAGPYDRILTDVPCSSTGVLAKRPEARWKLKPKDYLKLPAIQSQILEKAASALKPEGVLVYSTCSLEEEENERVVTRLKGWRPTHIETLLPQAGRQDGAFVARLERK